MLFPESILELTPYLIHHLLENCDLGSQVGDGVGVMLMIFKLSKGPFI